MPRKRDEFVAPQVPTIPDAPGVPKRSSLRDKFASFAPDIPVPQPEVSGGFLNRKSAWASQFPNMSELEFIVIDYLTRVKRWKMGVDFDYQQPIYGGRTKFGGFVVDFFIKPNLALQPQGERWHLQQPEDRARLRVEKLVLGSRGVTTIYLWETDLLTRPDYTIEAALKHEQLNTFNNDL